MEALLLATCGTNTADTQAPRVSSLYNRYGLSFLIATCGTLQDYRNGHPGLYEVVSISDLWDAAGLTKWTSDHDAFGLIKLRCARAAERCARAGTENGSCRAITA